MIVNIGLDGWMDGWSKKTVLWIGYRNKNLKFKIMTALKVFFKVFKALKFLKF